MSDDARQPARPESYLSRQAFDETAARLGISGADDHMDELYSQLRGVLTGAASLRNLDVSGTEPDMAFIPHGPRSGG